MHVYMKWHNWKLLQSMPPGESMDMGKGYDDMISCAVDISVSASYSRYHNLAWSLLFPHIFLMYSISCIPHGFMD